MQLSGAWAKVAKQRGLTIVAGIAERAGAELFNSAAIIGPDGQIGTFRKVHMWNEENLFFEPGNLGFPVQLRSDEAVAGAAPDKDGVAATYGASVQTLRQFLEGYEGLVKLVRDRMLP